MKLPDHSTPLLPHRTTPAAVNPRRRHPFISNEGLAEAIAQEREAMQPLRETADIVVDTSDLNVHQLRRLVITDVGR